MAGSDLQRMDTLDGLRGAAALAVVAYHFFVRWAQPQFDPTLYSHGDALATFFPLQVAGQFGVLLFFLISGFVIMMTLERASGVADFFVRRSARLWPTMIFCATVSTLLINTSGVAHIYENVSRWEVTPVEYFSSILFIPPDFMADIFGISQSDKPRWVEGVYWTLFAEVRFYALIGLAYLLSPRATFIWVWAGIQTVSTMLVIAGQMGTDIPGAASLIFQPPLLGWFTLGLVAWRWRAQGPSPALVAALIAALIAQLAGPVISLEGGISIAQQAPRRLVLYAMIGLPFILFLRGSVLLAPLRWPPVLAIGLASYPLYLMHERTGMIYLDWLNSAGLHPWISVTLTIAAVIVIALGVHRFVEMPAKSWITRRGAPAAARIQARLNMLKY